MKTTAHFIIALSLVIDVSLALAQEERPPKPSGAPPSTNPERERNPGQPPPRDSERSTRREGARPPEGERRYDGPREGRGERWPESGRRHDGLWNMPLPPPGPPKPTRYLGVVTTPLPPALAAQLGLAEGFGVLVSDVLPDSPAAKAGLEQWDVLTKFNDQQLVAVEQLATLVRTQAKDAEVSLTLLREGQEQKVTATIGEKLMPERRSLPGPEDWQREMEKWRGPAMDATRRLQERMREFGERLREYQERFKDFQKRLKDWQKDPSGDAPQPPQPPELGALPPGPGVPAEDILREVRPGGQAQIRITNPQGGVVYNTGSARVRIKDDMGEIEISTRDGQRMLVAKNAAGETIFDGPVDTEQQRAELPAEVREKLRHIDIRASVSPVDPVPFVPGNLAPNVQ